MYVIQPEFVEKLLSLNILAKHTCDRQTDGQTRTDGKNTIPRPRKYSCFAG